MANRMPFCHRISKIFQPTNAVPVGAEVKHNNLLSKSLKLMTDRGIIAHSQTGLYYLLPLGTRTLDKLTRLVEDCLTNIGAQKIVCPTLTSCDLWNKTDRLTAVGPELIQLKDRHGKSFLLSPTHEESVAALLAAGPLGLSHKRLPLLLYQTTAKFRDEMKPRFGLIRAREFLMNDLYSFDTCEETAQESYQLVTQTYEHILDTIGVKYSRVSGLSGVMGGQQSHEFHYPADIGDDTLAACEGCGYSWNWESGETQCRQCGGDKVTHTKGIEVGHTFLLGTKYSAALRAVYTPSAGGSAPLVMGSYGLGLSRLVGAVAEVLSVEDQLRWPPVLAPYTLCIVPPKAGSKESQTAGRLAEEMYWILQEVPGLKDNVVIDDRSQWTIGRRVDEARRTGYPYALVVGKAAAQPDPRVELINIYTGQSSLHPPSDLIPVIVDSCQKARACLC